jgi:DNA-binding transcriptional regulator YiaG
MKDWTPKEIEQFRKDNKLSRKALGELLGVTVSSIYQWERGLKRQSKTTKLLLSRIEQDLKENEKGKEGEKRHGKRHLQKR